MSSQMESEELILHQPSLVIINTDDSGSMHWDDFNKAVEGGKMCIEYLRRHHMDHESVDLQLWYNTCGGVSCCYKGNLAS